MSRQEMIKFITYRFQYRDPNYPVSRFEFMSDRVIAEIYRVESDIEQQEIDEAEAAIF